MRKLQAPRPPVARSRVSLGRWWVGGMSCSGDRLQASVAWGALRSMNPRLKAGGGKRLDKEGRGQGVSLA